MMYVKNERKFVMPPPALKEQNAETKFSSSLIEKIGGRAKLKIMEENFIEA